MVIGIFIKETSSSAAIEILGQYEDISSIQTAELVTVPMQYQSSLNNPKQKSLSIQNKQSSK